MTFTCWRYIQWLWDENIWVCDWMRYFGLKIPRSILETESDLLAAFPVLRKAGMRSTGKFGSNISFGRIYISHSNRHRAAERDTNIMFLMNVPMETKRKQLQDKVLSMGSGPVFFYKQFPHLLLFPIQTHDDCGWIWWTASLERWWKWKHRSKPPNSRTQTSLRLKGHWLLWVFSLETEGLLRGGRDPCWFDSLC